MRLFKKKETKKEYNPTTHKPVIKASICNGERVAGFINLETGKFEEVMLIVNDGDLDSFKRLYRITEEIEKIY